jgi:DNA-directed RNA polymerase subunit beta
LRLLDIDHVNTGAYIRNTLMVDKVESREKRCSTSTA